MAAQRQSGVPTFVTAVRACGVPSWRPQSDSFSSLWAAFTLTDHINALYNESIHGKEEHATLINTIPLKNNAFIRVFCVEPMKSMRLARVFTLR